jgi:hypothetical protein
MRDLALVVRAHLDDGEPVRILETAQRDGHADVIVQVALGCQARAQLAEDRGRHFLDGRLAVAAGDAYHRAGERAPPCQRELRKRGERLRHDHLRQRNLDAPADQRSRRAARRHVCDEVVAVETLADEGDEQRARLDRTRIGHHAAEAGVGAVQRAAGHLREGCEIARDHWISSRHASTVARSLNRRVSVPTIW